MKSLAVIAAAVAATAVTTLSACATYQPASQTAAASPGAIQPNVMPYQAGNGVVQRVIPTPGQPLQRLEVRMDNGVVQYIDTDAPDITRGMRIALSADRMITKL